MLLLINPQPLIKTQILPTNIDHWIGLDDILNPVFASLLVHVEFLAHSDIYLTPNDW